MWRRITIDSCWIGHRFKNKQQMLVIFAFQSNCYHADHHPLLTVWCKILFSIYIHKKKTNKMLQKIIVHDDITKNNRNSFHNQTKLGSVYYFYLAKSYNLRVIRIRSNIYANCSTFIICGRYLSRPVLFTYVL